MWVAGGGGVSLVLFSHSFDLFCFDIIMTQTYIKKIIMMIKIVANQIITSETGNEVIAIKEYHLIFVLLSFLILFQVIKLSIISLIWMETCNMDSMYSVEIISKPKHYHNHPIHQ